MDRENEKPILTIQQEFVGLSLEHQYRSINLRKLPAGLCFPVPMPLSHSKHDQNEFKVTCTYTYDRPVEMPDDIDYCNKYAKPGDQTLEDLKALAIPIDKHKRKAGFSQDGALDGNDQTPKK